MSVYIVDHRFDSKHKSSVNRGRFIKRFKGQIRKAVTEAINRRNVRDLDDGDKISIPSKDITEPQFQHGAGGIWEVVRPGNDRFNSGDQIDRPPNGGDGQGSGKASNEGESLDDFVFTLTRDEFLDIFFDELALPNLIKQQLARISRYRRIRAGYTQTGVPTNINLDRTMRGAARRRIAIGGPYASQLKALQADLDQLLKNTPVDTDAVDKIRREIAVLHAKIEAIPFVDTFDLRYNNRIRVPHPTTQAVMFCLLDVSASMDEEKKNIAKRFFMLLYLFLTRNYEHIEVVFIRHHTIALEVDEDDFFTSRESGGTVVSSALHLMKDIISKRYPSNLWNIYGAQASDGDNWSNDSAQCRELLDTVLLPLTQYFAYIEITGGAPQNLWEEYEKLTSIHSSKFAIQHIATAADIYPVFRELFKKRL